MAVSCFQIHCWRIALKAPITHLKMVFSWGTVVIPASPTLWHHMEILATPNKKPSTKPTARPEFQLSKPLVCGSDVFIFYTLRSEWNQRKSAFSLAHVRFYITLQFCWEKTLMTVIWRMNNPNLLSIVDLKKAGCFETIFATHFLIHKSKKFQYGVHFEILNLLPWQQW